MISKGTKKTRQNGRSPFKIIAKRGQKNPRQNGRSPFKIIAKRGQKKSPLTAGMH